MENFKNRKNPVEVSQDNQNIKCFNLIMTYDSLLNNYGLYQKFVQSKY